MVRHGAWIDRPDTLASRRERVLREIGYSIINRRLQSLGRLSDPPFRAAGISTEEVFHEARSTTLLVQAAEAQAQPLQQRGTKRPAARHLGPPGQQQARALGHMHGRGAGRLDSGADQAEEIGGRAGHLAPLGFEWAGRLSAARRALMASKVFMRKSGWRGV